MTENAWDQFVETCRRENDQVRTELREVDMLIQQTSSDIDRFMQTNSRAVARARQIEVAFDTAPREDIKTTYECTDRHATPSFHDARATRKTPERPEEPHAYRAKSTKRMLEHTSPDEHQL